MDPISKDCGKEKLGPLVPLFGPAVGNRQPSVDTCDQIGTMQPPRKSIEFRISTPSPATTPRQVHPVGLGPAAELKLAAAIAELRRQSEVERRGFRQQLRNLERRMQEHLGTDPMPAPERFADMQGSVSGLTSEMAGLSRRMDSVDERLQVRLLNCEELIRQNTRQIEQRFLAQQHKAMLAVATSEAMSKRAAARQWRLLQGFEDHSARLRHVEEKVEGDCLKLQIRCSELETKRESLEEEVRNHARQVHRLETLLAEQQLLLCPDVGSALVRTGALELRVESLEQRVEDDNGMGACWAERAEVLRLDASLQELVEPLRRLSQRTAGTETATALLERRLDQLTHRQDASQTSEAPHATADTALQDLKLEEIADLKARMADIEALLEGADDTAAKGGWLSPMGVSGGNSLVASLKKTATSGLTARPLFR